MTFKDWMLNFQGFGDDVVCGNLDVSPAKLNDWKTFVRDYRKANQRYAGSLELVAAYYATFPAEKPVGDMTASEFKALLPS